jgi:hypothetical protein
MRLRGAVAGVLLAVLGAGAAPAQASWPGSSTAGNAHAKAVTVPAGATPAVSVSGRNVTVSWSATTVSGQAVTGYVVKRYNASAQAQTVGSACSGTVTATTCTEAAVPAGTWTYKVTPKLGNWVGTESTSSPGATVAAADLSFSSSTTLTTLPSTLSGTISGFVTGSTVTYRLDNATTGTVLTGSTSPSPIAGNGSAAVTVTIPSGTANGAHTVYAVGSDGTVAGAAITVAVVTCPTSAPSLVWLTGMELAPTTQTAWGWTSGSASYDTAVTRNGAYSLKLAPTSAAAYRGAAVSTTSAALVARFAIRLTALPTADTQLAMLSDQAHFSNLGYLSFRYLTATQKFALGFTGGATISSTSTVQAGSWYVVQIRFDPRTTTHTADWRINDVAQTSTSVSGTATSANSFVLGSTAAATFSANYDDLAVSATATDYPFGDGKALPLQLDGMGTSVGAGNFLNDDGTAIGATSWSRLDEIPFGGGTDYVKQTVASSTSYVEMTLEDTTETCVRGVYARMAYDPQNSSAANNGKTVIADGAIERTVYSGAMNGTISNMQGREAAIPPTGVTWTAAALNALKARIGYSTDVAPTPMWHALSLEYEVPQ